MVLFLTQTFYYKHHNGNCGQANAPCSSINNKNIEYVEKKHAKLCGMAQRVTGSCGKTFRFFCAEQRQ